MPEQLVAITPRTTTFTAVCDECSREAAEPSWVGATFSGMLELDLDSGVFLCRRGHRVRVTRAKAQPVAATEAA
jgi:hypothetical protein